MNNKKGLIGVINGKSSLIVSGITIKKSSDSTSNYATKDYVDEKIAKAIEEPLSNVPGYKEEQGANQILKNVNGKPSWEEDNNVLQEI